MSRGRIDLNADLGEGYGAWRLGDDEAMLGVVTSGNLACGFHAGDPAGLRRTCAAAVAAGVRIGAQVSYPDRVGFGRRYIDIHPADLRADVIYQVGALDAIARSVGGRVEYVKPHGALYNTIAVDESQAAAVVGALTDLGGDLPLLGPAGSVSARLAAGAGLNVVAEAFADRAYRPDGTLTPRSDPGAVLVDTDSICARVLQMVTEGSVVTDDGSAKSLAVQSICLHGDTPGAVDHARAVAETLRGAGIDIVSFLD
ncbi:LamB/YcsF family protein [Williamsia sp. CHRR-6]|uniref:LamB/YcsF family protein n=1 Tax=Williamsia sp. CHRR-6 TaxID=2835871 RepID=UPI001BDA1619|nr:5-oxoprolinase subunit PxpA [Williamsia sp. CHRR-6]MBT0566016.1 LamB/YcsF family protein [Williamsia sp. CHRR-6]